jgi:hypothetical protein
MGLIERRLGSSQQLQYPSDHVEVTGELAGGFARSINTPLKISDSLREIL